MKKFLLLPLLALSLVTMGQKSQKPPGRNTIFLEAGGNGFFYSLNYDRILKDTRKWKLAGRAGAMYVNYFRKDQRQMFGIPLELSYLRGRRNHFLELGFGLTPVYDTSRPSPWPETHEFVVISAVRLGYRHQKRDGGLFFKAGFIPLGGLVFDLTQEGAVGYNELEKFAYPWAGLAVGWTLKGRNRLGCIP